MPARMTEKSLALKVGDVVEFLQHVKGKVHIRHVVLIVSGGQNLLSDPWTFHYEAFYIESTSDYHRNSVKPFQHNTVFSQDYKLLYSLEP